MERVWSTYCQRPGPSPNIQILLELARSAIAASRRVMGRRREALIDVAVELWSRARQARRGGMYLARFVGAFAFGLEGGEALIPASGGRTARVVEAGEPGARVAMAHLYGDSDGGAVTLEDLRWAAGKNREVYWEGEDRERAYIYLQLQVSPAGPAAGSAPGPRKVPTRVLVYIDDKREEAFVDFSDNHYTRDPEKCPRVAITDGYVGLDALLAPLLAPAGPRVTTEARRKRIAALEAREGRAETSSP